MRHADAKDLCKYLRKLYKQYNLAKPQNLSLSPPKEGYSEDSPGVSSARTLQFNSLFPSGNLQTAIRSSKSSRTYYIECGVDTNTVGDSIASRYWHFEVKGGEKGEQYTFKVCNFEAIVNVQADVDYDENSIIGRLG